MNNNEAQAESYDVQQNAYEFDGSRWKHTNSQWEGDRYVLVYFNIDFSQHDRWRGLHGPDHRTEEARAAPLLTRPVCTPIDTASTECVELRQQLLHHIQQVQLLNRPQLKYQNKKSEIILFGECTQPYHVKERHACKGNELYPVLHALLKQYIDFIMQKPVSHTYSTILLAKNKLGNIIANSSIGLVLKKKRGKKSVANGAQLASESIITQLIDLDYNTVFIRIKGFGRGRESALFGFTSSILTVEQIIDVTPMPHNGCRPKRARRI